MFDLKKLAGLAAAALVASGVSASAAVVTALVQVPAANTVVGQGIVAPAYGAFLPPGATNFLPSVAVNPPPVSRNDCLSPFAIGLPGYHCVTGVTTGGTPSVATLSFTPGQTSLNMLWGSIDTYNTLEFLNAGDVVGTVLGQEAADVANGGVLNCGTGGNCGIAAIFTFTFDDATTFDQVRFTTTQAAFEVAFVPLPAAAWLMLAGLGGLGLMSRRRAA